MAALGDRGRHSPAGAGPDHRYPVGIDCQLGGIFTHPSQHRQAVVEPGRKRVLRSQPVVGRHHHSTEISGKTRGTRRLELGRPDDVSAAVQPQHPRRGRGTLIGSEHHHRYRWITDVAFDHGDAGTRLGGNAQQQPSEPQFAFGEPRGDERQQRTAQFGSHVQQGIAHLEVTAHDERGRRQRRKCKSLPHTGEPRPRVPTTRPHRSNCGHRCDMPRPPDRPPAARCRRRSPTAPNARAAYGPRWRP